MQLLSRKFEVIEENRTKPSSLLSVFLQTDQMWPLMWSSGFHFFLLRFSSQRSTFDVLNDKYVKRVKKGFLDTAVDYQWNAAANEADLRHDFRLSATI